MYCISQFSMHAELQETRAGKEALVLTRAVDLSHYKKLAVVKLRKRVRELEHSLEQQTKCIEDKNSANVELNKRVEELNKEVALLEQHIQGIIIVYSICVNGTAIVYERAGMSM